MQVLQGHVQVTCCEGAHQHHGFGVLADVDEAAGPGQARTELAYVQIALGIGLGQAQDGNIQTSTIVKVKLVGLVDHRLRIDRSTKAQAAGRDAANHARLGRKGN